MNECEHDRRIDRSEWLILPGKQYHLTLEGKQWVGRRWVGSEYLTAYPEHYWFEGTGTLDNADTGLTIRFFTFQTWKEERHEERKLEDFVFASWRWDSGRGGYEAKLSIVESRRADLIDHICGEIVRKTAQSPKEPIPEVVFEQMRYEWLIEHGFVFDQTGQANLPNLSPPPA